MDGSHPVKILYFTRDDSVHDRRFLSAMVSAGMNVFLLRLQGGAGPLVNLPKGVKEVHWQDHKVLNVSSSNFNLIKNLQSVIRDIKPDLIHAGLLTSCANIAARSGFQPLVSMSWGSDILTAGWLNLRKKRMLKQTLEQTSVLIGDCEAVRQKAIAFGFPAERIVVFPWGVDLKLFSPGSD